ncbi:MAG: ExeA family protein [Phycisphaerae bacterium]
MYVEFYQLKDEPFRLTPDPRYLYLTVQHQEALNHLMYGIQQKKGFICLTGEVGTGKTTLLRHLMDELDNDRKMHTAMVLNPVLTEVQMLRCIVEEFGISSRRQDRLSLLRAINKFLLDCKHNDETAVLLIDEAQDIPPKTLEMCRLLSNLETKTEKLLQIVLVGQPELNETLGTREFRQLSQRITVRYHIDTMSESDTEEYIRHRLAVAGNTEDRGPNMVKFDRGAYREVFRFSQGTPRLVNAIGDKVLLAGFIYQTGKINRKIVRKAADELKGL